MIAQTSVAAATAVLGYNLLTGSVFDQVSWPRVLRGAALAGSAAALDAKIEIFIGTNKVAELYNSATGAPNRDHLFPINARIGPGEEVSAIVVDAPATNPLNGLFDFAP